MHATCAGISCRNRHRPLEGPWKDCIDRSQMLQTYISRHELFLMPADSIKSWFSGRGWGQQLFSFQSPAVHWIARSSSLNCLSCRNPYQTPDSLNCLPPFHWKSLFFTERCFVASPSQKSALINVLHAALDQLCELLAGATVGSRHSHCSQVLLSTSRKRTCVAHTKPHSNI